MTLPSAAFPLRTSGAQILGADGTPVRLAGVNWGGAQQDEGIPAGLDVLPRGQIIDRIKTWGMNMVRLPYATGAFMTSAGAVRTGPAKAARLAANPDLGGMSCLDVYCELVRDLTAAGIYVAVNQHLLWPGWCCSAADNAGLWYNDNWPSSVFTNCSVLLAQRLAGNDLVGYDIHNEWRPAVIGGATVTPTWGDGNPATDARQLMQNTIGRIRAAHPGALCFCEGLDYAQDLTGWRAHPVTGAGVVASIHDYSWFHPAGQSQADYYAQMDTQAGYLVTSGIAPLWVGEFGANTDAAASALASGWLPQFLSWAQARRVHWCWWELSATAVAGTEPVTNKVKAQPGQRELFGLAAGHDWLGSQSRVLDMLASLMT